MSDTTTKDDEAIKKFRERMSTNVAKVKAALLLRWLKPRDNEADSVCVTKDLFEIALDRHIALHGADGFDFEAACQRALKRWRGALQ